MKGALGGSVGIGLCDIAFGVGFIFGFWGEDMSSVTIELLSLRHDYIFKEILHALRFFGSAKGFSPEWPGNTVAFISSFVMASSGSSLSSAILRIHRFYCNNFFVAGQFCKKVVMLSGKKWCQTQATQISNNILAGHFRNMKFLDT